ncbi:MAG: HEAT repeat domain-containing protein [Nitrospirae bacterium]|nr:HEAT repeat domain-containing protein [Nitrospirota bacterium]
MADLKTAQEMLAEAVAARGAEDPEIASVKRVLKLLDKTAKSNRTYGSTNPVAQKFSQQLFEELTAHLSTYSKLTFLVQRSELLCKEFVVYQAEKDGGSESIAFKLYADGIRELVLHQGLTQEDLAFFLDSLWGGLDPTKDDDDIVTRIWSRNLSTLSIVTAEEVAKASVVGDGFIRLDGGMSLSDSTLRELLDRERAKKGRAVRGTETSEGGTSTSQKNRFQSGLVGYEVTEEELAALAKEIEAESKQDNIMYILDMLTVILASEKSPALLTRLFSLWGDIVESLLREGKWTVLENVLGVLHETDSVRPDLSEEHKQQLASLFNGLGRGERVKAIETYLNRTPDANIEGLSTILLLMKADAVPALSSLLASLASPVHQAIVSEVLVVLAKDQPDPLLKGLSDRRPAYVRNLLSILIKLNNPKFVEPVEKLIRYPDAQIRKEAVRAIGLFRPSGNGTKLVPVIGDTDESVRVAALKLLMSGQYTAPFSLWSPILSGEDFTDRPMSERRAVFQAVRATCGDEAIPYWENLLTEWSWTNRKKKEELALLAAETLGKLATPAAIATLELGIKKGATPVRHACNLALSQIQKQQRGKQPSGISH